MISFLFLVKILAVQYSNFIINIHITVSRRCQIVITFSSKSTRGISFKETQCEKSYRRKKKQLNNEKYRI
jgi:hypothetical protein